MRQPNGSHQLVDAIYAAALDPAGWSRVMTALRRRFASAAEPFYVLDFRQHQVRPLCITGIPERFIAGFDASYFTPDNPWLTADALHAPGVVRTDRALYAFHRDAGVLHRSTYYDTWLRPQRLEHSLGVTLLDEDGLRANLTLLRPRDAGHYGRADVAEMRGLGRHLRQALRVSRRLDMLGAGRAAGHGALDRLPHGVLLLAADGRLLHANRAGDAILRAGDVLRLRERRLVAMQRRDAARLAGLLAAGADSMVLHRGDGGRLLATAMPLPAERSVLPQPRAALMLLLVDPDAVPHGDLDRLRQRFGLTDGELRLAAALLAGDSLRRAADAAGITYETARWYVKVLFQKTGTNRQADLVACLLGAIARLPA